MMMVVIMGMVMAVGMPMIMRMAAMGTMRVIGTASRLERFLDIADAGAQPLQHGADHVIAQDQDTAFLDLGGKMPITEMPGEFDQVQRIARFDFEQLFRRRLHFNRITIVEHQSVAMMEEHGLLEIEHHHVAIRKMQQLAAQVTQIMRQADGVDWRVGNLAGRAIGMDVLHDDNPLNCKIFAIIAKGGAAHKGELSTDMKKPGSRAGLEEMQIAKRLIRQRSSGP